MKRTVYIETTIVSYLTAEPSRDLVIAGRQQATRDLWAKLASNFDAFVSALVLQEGGQGNPDQARKRLEAIASFPALDIDDEARALAERILSAKAIPEEQPEDALHIAVSAVNGIQVLVTWNFAHLNNPFTRMRIRAAVEEAGYQCPEICSPEELLESEP
jgi:predicted nucleic acid-binding protein